MGPAVGLPGGRCAAAGDGATGRRCGNRLSAPGVNVLEQVHRPDLLNYTGEQKEMSNRILPFQPDYDEYDTAAAPVHTAAVASRMASDVLVVPRERGYHLGTVDLTDSCTLQVRVGAAIDMLGPGRAVRGRARYNSSQKSWFRLSLRVGGTRTFKNECS